MKSRNDVIKGLKLCSKEKKHCDECPFKDARDIVKNMCCDEILKLSAAELLSGEVMNNTPFSVTVDGMLSADYKERFKAEYQQLKIRVDKLNHFCNRIEAAFQTQEEKIEIPEHNCSLSLLQTQLHAMREYLHILEIRAIIEEIVL